MNDVNSLTHTRWNCKYHIVFAPKYRRKVFYGEKRREIGAILRTLCNWKKIRIIEAEVCPDHVHMLISATPQLCLGTMINSYKSVTSRIIRRLHEKHLAKYYWKPYFWNRSYLILSSGGASIETIKKYIQNQKKDAAITP